jgi:hypothetical protein
MKGHEADFVNRVEGMFSGTELSKIAAINDKVLKNAGVSRKLIEGQKASPADDPKSEITKGETKDSGEKRLTLEWKSNATDNADKKPASPGWKSGTIRDTSTKDGGNDKK